MENILYSGCLLNSKTSNPFGKQSCIILSSKPTNFLFFEGNLLIKIGFISSLYFVLRVERLDSYSQSFLKIKGFEPIVKK